MSKTIDINRAGVSVDQVIEAVHAELGSRYAIEHGRKPDSFTVKSNALTTASVELRREGTRATAVVTGGGFLIMLRVRNNAGIAREVADAIERSPKLSRSGG
ncbi:hypothetical protein [Streptacidiphilus sp. P02-A3a]|uniref:hypothetical protein n=1 Tax=Streptacidiphilus sp. P02-A3a TaxID=2704468 RepID=UPI0015F8A513|nr:hypothetical protein [Streptacidiphilus sp. P02-A3a]QMU73244.1 hypothetical protein GXP74_38460 [Streptacidiphilus sp. P02-A3a]